MLDFTAVTPLAGQWLGTIGDTSQFASLSVDSDRPDVGFLQVEDKVQSYTALAGIQVQEAVKLIHGLPTLASKGYVFEGMNHTSYVVEYTENPDCMSHYTVPEIVHLSERSNEVTLRDLRKRAQSDLGAEDVVIEFSRDVVQKFLCPACGAEEAKFAPTGSIPFEAARCTKDGEMRTVVSVHSYSGVEGFGDRLLSELGLPLLDLYVARHEEHEIGYIPSGDARLVLGNLDPEQATK